MLLNLQYHSAVSTPPQAARPAAGQKERERRGRGALGRAGKLIFSSVSAVSTRPVDSMLRCMRLQCVQVLSKHDEQQRRLQLVISFHLLRLYSRNVTQLLSQLKDEVRSIERRLREAQAAVAEQEAAMRADESEKHRAELRRQECSRQWAKDDEKLSALQRSVQANDPESQPIVCGECDPVSPIQAISLAQADFEGLFLSLKAAAQPGTCFFSQFWHPIQPQSHSVTHTRCVWRRVGFGSEQRADVNRFRRQRSVGIYCGAFEGGALMSSF